MLFSCGVGNSENVNIQPLKCLLRSEINKSYLIVGALRYRGFAVDQQFIFHQLILNDAIDVMKNK